MPCYPSASACMRDGKTRGRLNVPTVNDAALFFAHARVRFAQFLFFFSVRTDFTLPRNRAWRPRPRLGPGPGRGRGRTDDAAASTDRRLRDRPRPSDRRRARRPSVRLCASVRPFLRSVPPLHLRVQLSITHLTYCTSGRAAAVARGGSGPGPQNMGTVQVFDSFFCKARLELRTS